MNRIVVVLAVGLALGLTLALAQCAGGCEGDRAPSRSDTAPTPPPAPPASAASADEAGLTPESVTRQLDDLVGGHGAQMDTIAQQLDGKPWAAASAELSKRYQPPLLDKHGPPTWADPDQYGMVCTMIIGTDDGGVAHLVARTTTDPGPDRDDPDFARCARAKVHARGM